MIKNFLFSASRAFASDEAPLTFFDDWVERTRLVLFQLTAVCYAFVFLPKAVLKDPLPFAVFGHQVVFADVLLGGLALLLLIAGGAALLTLLDRREKPAR